MRWIMVGFAITAMAAAQTNRVYHLTQNETSQQLQEITTTIRAVGDIPQISTDAVQRTVAVSGTALQLAMADWLVAQLDRPVQLSGPQVYQPPAGADDLVRVFFLAHAATPQPLQEIVTTVRSVADIRRVFVYNPLSAMTVRDTRQKVAMAAWLVNQLDQPVGSPSPAPNEYRISGDDIARVFNLTNPRTPEELQEIVTTIRAIADMQRIFVYAERKTIALRGPAERVELAAWLVKQLDRPAPVPKSTAEYQLPSGADNQVRLFYPAQDPIQIATQIRKTARIGRMFVYSALGALAVRGTVTEIATAEKIIDEMRTSR